MEWHWIYGTSATIGICWCSLCRLSARGGNAQVEFTGAMMAVNSF